ncbi:hypothetical protein ACFSOV_19580 [Pedobacter petrophilus]|uniref:hypothetical protein n=1 Tax=Pedobacter petrophilus TaxID=1908241 RepID=UPI001FD859D0|nr:hypothetical protein [Pedobacter petrophilus]
MEPQIIQIGKKAAIYSAAAGTFLLLAYLISKQDSLISIGISYILFAVFANVLILLALIIALFTQTLHWKKIVATIICVLLNIPLSIFYLSIVIH